MKETKYKTIESKLMYGRVEDMSDTLENLKESTKRMIYEQYKENEITDFSQWVIKNPKNVTWKLVTKFSVIDYE